MTASSPFSIDIRGLLGAEDLLALLELPPVKRRRLLNNVSKRVRSLSRGRVRSQESLDGSPFAPRKDQSKSKKKMETGLAKLLDVVRLTEQEAELGWRNRLTRYVAAQQNNGGSERVTAHQMRELNKVPPGTAATERQAKRLRQLNYRIRLPGKKKPSKPSVAWIQQNLEYTKAGLLIRVLDTEHKASTGKQAWNIQLPARQFLGASTSETSQLVNLVLRQTITSPR